MGAFSIFLITVVISVIAFLTGKILFLKFLKRKDLSWGVFASYFSLVVAGLFLVVFLPDFYSGKIFLLWGLAGGIILWMDREKHSRSFSLFLQILLCAASVLSFSALSFSARILWQFPLLTLTLWLCWRIFVWFDRFPFISFINVLAWTLALAGMGFLISSVPNFSFGAVFLLGTTGIILMRSNLTQKIPNFGRGGALLLGFYWSSFFVCLISTGAAVQTLCFSGYYIFEALVLGVAFLYRRPLIPFTVRLLEQPKLVQKGMGIIFVHQLILSFWGAMILLSKNSAVNIVIFALVVILIDLSIRLYNLEHPAPTYKELFVGTKNSVLLAISQLKKGFSLKRKKTVKKSSKKKKTVKKVRKK